MNRALSDLDKILRDINGVSQKDKEFLAKACINRYKETIDEINRLENKKHLYDSFTVGFLLGTYATGILIASLNVIHYFKGDIQDIINLNIAYAGVFPIFLFASYVSYKLANKINDKIRNKESEASLYQLCYKLLKEE